MAAVFMVGCGDVSGVRPPSPRERAEIVRAVKQVWEYESNVQTYIGLRLHLRPSTLRPAIARIRVSRADPRFASVAVELRDVRGRRSTGTVAIVLRRGDDPRLPREWVAAAGPAVQFPLACTAATTKPMRQLLCPDAWSILDYPRPRLHIQDRLTTRIRAADVFSVDWKDALLPGAVCGAGKPIRLRNGQAFVTSQLWPWWPIIAVSAAPPSWQNDEYGDLDGDGNTNEAAVGVVCSNGGGTAAGQLGFSSVIFTLRGNVLRAIGVLTPRQPLDPYGSHVPLLGHVEILDGKVLAHEAWYAPQDGTCCPSGRATTIWTYTRGTLRPRRTVVVLPPRGAAGG